MEIVNIKDEIQKRIVALDTIRASVRERADAKAKAIAEYDESDNLSRRYIHGTRGIDERAVLLEGEGDELDTFYYMLQELDTVTGLITKNGTLAEAYTYDAYGKVSVWGYPAAVLDPHCEYFNAQSEFNNSHPSSPATDPMAD